MTFCYITDGVHLIEVDRVLRPGGYFVWTSAYANTQARDKQNLKRWDFVRNFAKDLCWDLLSQQDKTVVWKKPSKKTCYASRYIFFISLISFTHKVRV